jgi:hypothetical protein
MLKAAGASMLIVGAAGCMGEDDDDDNNGDEQTDDDQDDQDDGDGGELSIDPGETILLEGYTSGWVGAEPSEIEGEENPTLVLQDGEDYEIAWEQGDGSSHDLVLWDEDEEVVDDYETPPTTEPDPEGDQLLEFTATDEIAYYRCTPHGNMQGEIEIE